MKASTLGFRFRTWIVAGFYALGFFAPWERYLLAADGPGVRSPRLWSWLAFQLYQTRWMTSQQAFQALLGAAIVFAFAGAALQVWGVGRRGRGRSAFFAGEWMTGAAVSLLMPHTGGFFFVIALGIFELWMVLGWARSAGPQGKMVKPRWFRCLVTGTYPLGVALCLATFGWTYDAALLTRCVIVCFGASLVAGALTPPEILGMPD